MPSDPDPVTVRLRRVMPPTPFANTPTPLELLIVKPESSVLLARVTDVPVDESSTGKAPVVGPCGRRICPKFVRGRKFRAPVPSPNSDSPEFITIVASLP